MIWIEKSLSISKKRGLVGSMLLTAGYLVDYGINLATLYPIET
ncbi:hypothetical protein ACJJID_05295 [Microbulbifer sp. CnH-101-G]